ncbi:unnamed protein product [Caenorhabditis auriculariae]|uniref:Ig-like domain-containing protein n=1 Tax=Caenorhabditis auriculariae TaxID=2777116 RepID=A0A8S1GZC9_9PELO|nr:unnamed protein product [Caenorhabditis auriculariae]
MRTVWLLVSLCVAAVQCSNEPTEDEGQNPLTISADHMDYDSNTILIRQGKKLMISCVFAREDIADKSDLQWRKKDGNRIIDGESSPSVFTVEVLEHHTHHKKTSLHFTNIHQRDEGSYECHARTLGGQDLHKTVQIKVLEEIQWKDPTFNAGALVGEPLTIDCGIRNAGKDREKDPQIEITDGNGEPLDDQVFTIAGNEATVQELTKELNGVVVSCVHIEMANTENIEDFPVVDRRDVQIDVWHKPEFESESSVQYAIIDDKIRDATIHCNVTSSNPPARHFAFFLDGNQELNDPAKYSVVKEVGQHQGAHLTIFNVNVDDLHTYRCEASNGKTKSSLDIHLREANPPSEPKVTLLEAKKTSIVWKIEADDDVDSPIPVSKIEIRFIRDAVVEDRLGAEHEDSNIDDAFWRAHGGRSLRDKKTDGIYEVHGLRHASGYVWRFRQISEAGYGDAMVLRASTLDELAAERKSSARSALCSFVILILTLVFW